ncbi:MAG: 1-acyl-sn-glycerol-3-phosphate acyltransferase [Clostridia bacterium]|nr:1-acyl-sn-glycerol-3-phosphate acyltransferase [Clostridia bacterium]
MSEEKKALSAKNQDNLPAKPVKRSGAYTAARGVAAFLFHTFVPVSYEHPERLTMEGPYIVIANHFSNFDPLIVGYPIKHREITFLGKKELTKNGLLKKMFDNMHMIAIDRHNMDMEAMRACMRALKEGEILGVFPEGTRHHAGVMEEPAEGVGLIALRSKVPLVPVYIDRKAGFFRKTRVYVGNPLNYEDIREKGINRETCHELMERIQTWYQGAVDGRHF